MLRLLIITGLWLIDNNPFIIFRFVNKHNNIRPPGGGYFKIRSYSIRTLKRIIINNAFLKIRLRRRYYRYHYNNEFKITITACTIRWECKMLLPSFIEVQGGRYSIKNRIEFTHVHAPLRITRDGNRYEIKTPVPVSKCLYLPAAATPAGSSGGGGSPDGSS